MKGRVVVLGAGMGGLSAALRLARRGARVTLLEAGPEPGGLAAGFVHEGFLFDGGPYILLDRPGLEWALRALDIELEEHLRLIAPMRHEDAGRGGEAGQRAYLEQVLSERWWREPFEEIRVLQTRIPAQWGARNHLYRESMNPGMTARFMRQGRIAHRSPHIRGLYLAGSSTHPGQWVSICAISGVLSADSLYQDLTA